MIKLATWTPPGTRSAEPSTRKGFVSAAHIISYLNSFVAQSFDGGGAESTAVAAAPVGPLSFAPKGTN